ncbi:MAG: glycosyltransferase family 4 protein [Arenimonas sp.]
MKIWFPMPETNNGAEIFTRQLSSALSARGIEIVITRYPKYIEAMPWLLATIRAPAKIDLIHLNTGSASGFFHHGIPSVITAHGASERAVYDQHKTFAQRIYHSILLRPGIQKAVAKATRVTGVSQWLAGVYQREYAACNVDIIHNWVDADVFVPIKKPLKRKLLFVGRPAWQKGSHLLPKLSSLLGNEFEITCTFDKNDWPVEIPGNIKFAGSIARNKMPALYQAHDALLVPSIAEGFCLAAVEAMSCGLPVFGFRGHGLDDAWGPLADKVGVDLPDMEALSSLIKDVFDQPALYQDISELGRHHVRTSFTEAIALEKYLSIYRSIIE